MANPTNTFGNYSVITIISSFPQIDGSAKFDIPLTHIKQISHYLNSRSLVVEANVTESLNSITLNGSSKVKFYDKAVKLEFLKSNPKTFKPGLPYTAYVSKSYSKCNIHVSFCFKFHCTEILSPYKFSVSTLSF